jgi:hypothetical protein
MHIFVAMVNATGPAGFARLNGKSSCHHDRAGSEFGHRLLQMSDALTLGSTGHCGLLALCCRVYSNAYARRRFAE